MSKAIGKLPLLVIGEDRMVKLKVKSQTRDADDNVIVDEYCNIVYVPVDLTPYTQIALYITVQDTGRLICRYDLAGSTDHEPLTVTDAANGIVTCELKREYTKLLQDGDVLIAEVSGVTSEAAYEAGKFVRLFSTPMAKCVKGNSKLQAHVG